MLSYHATLRSLRQSPRKVRLLSNALVGLSVPEAQARLSATVRAASTPLGKLLHSAAANALDRDQIAPEALSIASLRVDAGTVLKRFHPRAFGRGAPIRRRSSHISVFLVAPESAKGQAKQSASIVQSPAVPVGMTDEKKSDATAKSAPPEGSAGQPKVQKKIEPKTASQGFMRRLFQRKSGM